MPVVHDELARIVFERRMERRIAAALEDHVERVSVDGDDAVAPHILAASAKAFVFAVTESLPFVQSAVGSSSGAPIGVGAPASV
jgi:hypothetical protein